MIENSGIGLLWRSTGEDGGAGVCLAWLDAYHIRLAMMDGTIKDVPAISYNPTETDGLEMTEYLVYQIPATAEDMQEASKEAARIAALFEANRLSIADVETEIQRQQEELAARIRGQHSALYLSQQVTAAWYELHKKRLKDGALKTWHAAGQPERGKTFGAAQVKVTRELVSYDEAGAVGYCETQAPGLVVKAVDKKKFLKGIKDGIFSPPESVAKFQDQYSVAILESRLLELADDSE